jgi:MFS family permease
MLRAIIYLFPALADLLLGSFFFITTVRMAESHASAMAVSGLITVWGATYMIFCPLVGRIVTPTNCVRMMVSSCAAMACCAAAFVVFQQLAVLYVIMAAFGAVVAFFFPPFMVFMKAFESTRGHGPAYSAAVYTFAWSLGLATGPFLAGYIWTTAGWQWVCVMDILLACGAGIGIFALRAHAHNAPASRETPAAALGRPLPDYSRMPDLIRLAWLGVGVCMLVIAAVRGLFPSSAAFYSVSKAAQGNTLALIYLAQAAVALLLANGRTWMYRPLPVATFGLVGLAGLVLFGLAHSPALYYAAAVCAGVYGGASCIYLAFHALVHPSRTGRYVGINEAIVGFTGIIGPAAAGLLADNTTVSVPYFAAALLVGLAVVLQVVVHSRHRETVKLLQG